MTNDPNIPGISPKQLGFLILEEHEALFGGSAGGGKSESLLITALQYVDDYPTSSLILRRTYRDLDKPGGLMFRAREWLAGTKAHWDGINYRWIFPSGATLNFGYLEHEGDELKFQSSEYQTVCYDELTHFPEHQYLYLFSRLRRLKSSPVPLRMRSGTNPGGCVPYGDVLTPGGWKPINLLNVGDPIFTVDTDGVMVETVVSRTYKLPWTEQLVSVNARGLNMVVTHDHRVARVGGSRWNHGAKFTLTTFDSLPGQSTILRSVSWVGEELVSFTPERVETGKRRLNQPLSLSGDLYMQLLGWVLSEGYTVARDRAFFITQTKKNHRITIENLLVECGFEYRKSDTTFSITSPEWSAHFKTFGLCRDKYIPERVKAAPKRQLEMLLMAMMSGDGHWHDGADAGGEYYTTSKRLADDMSEIALKCGYIVYQSHRDRENREGLSHIVSIKKVKSGGTELLTGNHKYDVKTETKRRSDIERIDYSGMVYCIGVDGTETFIIRQNGSVWVSGNSGHEWVRRRFNLPDGPNPGTDRVFIKSSLMDNPFLEHDEYIDGLNRLGKLTRDQLLHGDWTATSTGGYFQAEKFRVIGWDEVPPATEFVAIIRYWDFAATEPSELNPDPDYTVGLKIGLTKTGSNDPSLPDWYVLDVERFRGNPGTVENRVKATALRDGPNVVQWLEQERGAAGKLNFRNYAVNVLTESTSRPLYATGSKEDKARIAAARVNEGRVFLVDGEWVGDFLSECAVFPMGSHDDQIDGLSNGIIAIDKERSFASQGTVRRLGQVMKPVRRGEQNRRRPHYGY